MKNKKFLLTGMIFIIIILGFGILVYWALNPLLTKMELFFELWWIYLVEFLLVGIYNHLKYK